MTIIKTLSAALLCGSFAIATSALAQDFPGVSSAAPSNSTSSVNDRTTLHAPEVDKRINQSGNVAPDPNIPQTQNDVNPNLSSQANADRSNINQAATANPNLSSSDSAVAVRSNATYSPAPRVSASMTTGSKMGRPNARQFREEQQITRQLNNQEAAQ